MTVSPGERDGPYAFVQPWSLRMAHPDPYRNEQVEVHGLTAVVPQNPDTTQYANDFARIFNVEHEWQDTAEFARRPDVPGMYTVLHSRQAQGTPSTPERDHDMMERLTQQLDRRYRSRVAIVESSGSRGEPDRHYPSRGERQGSVVVQYTGRTEPRRVADDIQHSLDELAHSRTAAAGPLSAHLAGGREKFHLDVVSGHNVLSQHELNEVVKTADRHRHTVENTDRPGSLLHPSLGNRYGHDKAPSHHRAREGSTGTRGDQRSNGDTRKGRVDGGATPTR